MRMQTRKFKDIHGRKHKFTYPRNTSIAPDVIIDRLGEVRIGCHSVIRSGVVLRPEGGEIVIGDHCTINHYTVLGAKGGVYIGDWTIIANHCSIYAQNHRSDSLDRPITSQGATGYGVYLVGDNWLGAHAFIGDDVTLGKGAIVGANATVIESAPMASVVVGSPARIIRKRYKGPWTAAYAERASAAGDMPEERLREVEDRGRRVADLIKADDRILDVGCGEGLVTAVLNRSCAGVVGCDYSKDALSIARETAPGVEFKQCNATRLLFDDGSFTAVTFTHVAEQMLRPQLERSLDQIRRVLADGGRLFLTTPKPDAPPLSEREHDDVTTPPPYARIHEFSNGEMTDLLASRFGVVRLVDPELRLFVAEK